MQVFDHLRGKPRLSRRGQERKQGFFGKIATSFRDFANVFVLSKKK